MAATKRTSPLPLPCVCQGVSRKKNNICCWRLFVCTSFVVQVLTTSLPLSFHDIALTGELNSRTTDPPPQLTQTTTPLFKFWAFTKTLSTHVCRSRTCPHCTTFHDLCTFFICFSLAVRGFPACSGPPFVISPNHVQLGFCFHYFLSTQCNDTTPLHTTVKMSRKTII